MKGTTFRAVVVLVAPLAYGIVAFWAQAAADRAFDARMLRDRMELAAQLKRHGATEQQVADLVAYEAAVSHDVSGVVHTTTTAGIGSLIFLGVTLGGFVAFGQRRGDARRGEQAGAG